MDPWLLKRFLDEVSARSREISEAIDRRIRAAERIAESCRDLLKPLPPPARSTARVAGLDGSFQVVGPSHLRLLLAVAVLIELPQGLESHDVEVVFAEHHVDVVHGIDDVVVRGAAEDIMMLLETRGLEHVDKLGGAEALFIDGPLMDPPRPLLPESRGFFEKAGLSAVHDRYHGWRASALLKAVEEGLLAVGYVKRPGSDELLLRAVKSCGKEYSALFEGDDDLVASMLVARPELRTSFIGPVEYPSEHPLYQEYLRRGVHIAAAYIVPPGRARPVRVEVAVVGSDPEEAILRAVALTMGLTPTGLHHPLPVVLAHERCSISRDAAATMLRELVSRVLSSLRLRGAAGPSIVEGWAEP